MIEAEKKMLINDLVDAIANFDRMWYQRSPWYGNIEMYIRHDPFYNNVIVPTDKMIYVFDTYFAGYGLWGLWREAVYVWEKRRYKLLKGEAMNDDTSSNR